MGPSVGQSFHLTSMLASVDFTPLAVTVACHCLIVPGTVGSHVRADWSSSVPSISHMKEGTLTSEISCIVELLIMKAFGCVWRC